MAQDSSNVDDTEFAWRGALNSRSSRIRVCATSFASSFRIPSLTETETFWTGEFRFGRRNEPFSAYQLTLPIPSSRARRGWSPKESNRIHLATSEHSFDRVPQSTSNCFMRGSAIGYKPTSYSFSRLRSTVIPSHFTEQMRFRSD